MSSIAATTTFPVESHACKVMKIRPLSADTFQVELRSSVGTTLGYCAGQYLQLIVDLDNDGQKHSLAYSIVNRFDQEQPYRLQLFVQNRSECTHKLLKRLAELSEYNGKVEVALPMGRAYLQSDLELTHLLIAAGSGISKIKCVADEILNQQPNAHVKIYWSNKNIDDFYLVEEFQCLETESKNMSFTPILESKHAAWAGSSGYIYEVVKGDCANLEDAQVYLCGSPKMVYGTIDKLKPIGLREENCYSDVFEYAPRVLTA